MKIIMVLASLGLCFFLYKKIKRRRLRGFESPSLLTPNSSVDVQPNKSCDVPRHDITLVPNLVGAQSPPEIMDSSLLAEVDLTEPWQQVQSIKRLLDSGHKYNCKTLLNATESKAFAGVTEAVKKHNDACRTKKVKFFSQVSLGEVFNQSEDDKDANALINSKRVDFLLTDWSYNPLIALEIHGSYRSSSTASEDTLLRDEVKRLALESAGVVYCVVECSVDTAKEKSNQVLSEALNKMFSPVESAS
ncbi:MAG: DUF2726 domain-containing protein [Formosimonas sp.]